MNLLFDLDGTLTDSAEGILNSVKLVFQHYDITLPDEEVLHTFIGPPLEQTFPLFGIAQTQIEEAISLFRSRYETIGKFENRPYDGIISALTVLKKSGYHLYVATSKPENTAKEILSRFHMEHFFEGIYGASRDSSRVSKSQVIRYLLEQVMTDLPAIMVGDTTFDVVGAAELGIRTIGVSWGYGSAEDLLSAGAVAIAESPQKLPDIIASVLKSMGYAIYSPDNSQQ